MAPSLTRSLGWLAQTTTKDRAVSTSYGLVWEPGQVKMLFETAEANLSQYAIHTTKLTTRHIYEENKKRRMRVCTSKANAVS